MKISSIKKFVVLIYVNLSIATLILPNSHLHQLKPVSSAFRYIKQSIECGFFEEADWKKWKQEAKTGQLSREERIEMGKRHIEKNYFVIVNEKGRGGRYVVERNPFPELESTDF